VEHTALLIEAWSNFYVIIGSSAGGLTGLTFVVIALVSDAHPVRLTGLRAFITPTIIHFSSALALSALLNIPGQTSSGVALLLGVLGLWGVLYTAGTALHVKRIGPEYKPVAADWIWNVLLPLTCYLALLSAGVLAPSHVALALYITAGVSLLLLFLGIHNAWDIAVWFTAERPGVRNQSSPPPVPTEPPAK
jgi:hypothetical protein